MENNGWVSFFITRNFPVGLMCYHAEFGDSAAMWTENLAPLNGLLPRGVGAQKLIMFKLAQHKLTLKIRPQLFVFPAQTNKEVYGHAADATCVPRG